MYKKIISKKIKRVIFSINDNDLRSKNKAEKNLKDKKIIIKKFVLKNFAKTFYKSYFIKSSNLLPFIDAKLAISKDYFTINKKEKWITNIRSRSLGNFIRTKYDCLLTTSKTTNSDNPLLDCRIEGLENKTPTLVILDRHLKIKKNLKIFKNVNRKIYILTNTSNQLKENFLRKKGVTIVKFTYNKNENIDLKKILMHIKNLGFSRIFVEAGNTFLSKLIKNKLVKNLYLFKSSKNISSNGYNNSSIFRIKKLKFRKKNHVKVNLFGDNLYKVKL